MLSGCVVVTKWALHPVSAIRVGVSGGDRLRGKLVVEERIWFTIYAYSRPDTSVVSGGSGSTVSIIVAWY